MLMKIFAPVEAPRWVLLGRRAAAGLGLGRGRGAGDSALAFAGVVRTVGRSATGLAARGGSVRPTDTRRGSARLEDSRRGGSVRFGGSRRGGSLRLADSRRGGSERFGGSRRGGSARFGCLRGGSEPRGGTCGRRGWPAWGRGVAEGRLGFPFGSPGRGGRLSTPTPLGAFGYT
ncbi:hypothetical protein GCM10017774_52530 [Lentzea cavernae]|uniref:Uncharacterized protein n=2 Tax=Lentzea cavernae TaxID=2020703 RepID=A0ABQ3ML77_9PSEU|nr:hypothetical protein GCM10017774_52530 [Lentzea cavernae]